MRNRIATSTVLILAFVATIVIIPWADIYCLVFPDDSLCRIAPAPDPEPPPPDPDPLPDDPDCNRNGPDTCP